MKPGGVVGGTLDTFAAGQALLGIGVLARMLRGAAGDPIAVAETPPPDAGTVSVILPVLNERKRVGPALSGLAAQGPWVTEILVVDGGSHDGTPDLVRAHALRDPRIRLVDADPVPAGWNGKAWGLAAGLARSSSASRWVLTIDADVRPRPQLTASLLAHAVHGALDAFSAAPLLEISGAPEALVHPSMLATLVYRFGLPGSVALDPRDVQADGQCFFARRQVLIETDAISQAKASRCEDVSIARTLVRAGATVGFFEGSSLAGVAMYGSLRECWDNWPRSLPMVDASSDPRDVALQLAEVLLVQALPPLLLAALAFGDAGRKSLAFKVNLILTIVRLATLAGTRRAYDSVPATYWLSPLADLPVALNLVRSTFARRHVWRGRVLVSERSRA